MAEIEKEEEVRENLFIGMDHIELAFFFKEQRQAVKDANDALKTEKELLSDIEYALMKYAEENGNLLSFKVKDVGTISFGEEDVFSVPVEKWDDMFQYILENNAFYLLQRRVNNAAIKELVGKGTELPVSKFTRRKVGLRGS